MSAPRTTCARPRTPGGIPLSANDYAAEIRKWLEIRGYSKTRLGKAIGYTRPYVSKVASGVERGSIEFAQAADQEMNTGGEL